MSSRQHEKLIEIFQGMLSMEDGMPDSITAVINTGGLSFSQFPAGRQWQFTLPELYDFCCQSNSEIIELGYPGFRKLLYQHSTNQRIADSGGQFVVVKNKGHIDRNIYALTVSG